MKALKITPALKNYIWGGTKLKEQYNVKTDMDIVSEAWILSVHPDGNSMLENGKSLYEYIKKNPGAIGKNCEAFEKFPILIKFIDARESLSVQVHPDDSYALSHENEYGKTEMWYICDCEKDAYLYYGLNKTVTKEEFREAINNNTIGDILNSVKVKKGDLFFIPSGTIHAIGAGIVICEIQQNSNTTYRVYDYDRRDKNGNPRELHIEKAIEVSNLKENKNGASELSIEEYEGYTKTFLGSSKYFASYKLEIESEARLTIDDKTFNSIVVVSGECEVSGVKLEKGDSVFIPSQTIAETYEIKGKATVILSYVPCE